MSPLALSFSFVCILRVLRGDIAPDNRTLCRDNHAYNLCMRFCAPGVPLHNLTSVHQVHEYVVLNIHAVRAISCLPTTHNGSPLIRLQHDVRVHV